VVEAQWFVGVHCRRGVVGANGACDTLFSVAARCHIPLTALVVCIRERLRVGKENLAKLKQDVSTLKQELRDVLASSAKLVADRRTKQRKLEKCTSPSPPAAFFGALSAGGVHTAWHGVFPWCAVVAKLEQSFERQARDQAIAWSCLGRRLGMIQLRAMEWQLHEAAEGGVDGTLLSVDVSRLPLPSAEELLEAAKDEERHASAMRASVRSSAGTAARASPTVDALDVELITTPRQLEFNSSPVADTPTAATAATATPDLGASVKFDDPNPQTKHTGTPELSQQRVVGRKDVPGWPDVPHTLEAAKLVSTMPGPIVAAHWLNLLLLRASPALYAQHFEGLNAQHDAHTETRTLHCWGVSVSDGLRSPHCCGLIGDVLCVVLPWAGLGWAGLGWVGFDVRRFATVHDDVGFLFGEGAKKHKERKLKPEVALRFVSSADLPDDLRSGRLLAAAAHALFPSVIPITLAGVASANNATTNHRRVERMLPILYKVCGPRESVSRCLP